MALGDVIARLAVNLSLETAAFEKGATKSEKRMNQMKRKFSDFSKSIAIGGAAVVGAVLSVNKVFDDLAQKSKEIGIAAQVAGEGFEDFQRQAYGAKMVGIEVDKLGDIFKDVRDRIGDFTQTGGGPMADFFENIAPKVGITAKAFEGLGGKASLQLYYDSLKKANVSQEDMVFYLEAMASDATNLIPLLENGGAAWDRYGSKAAVITEGQRAQLQRYTDAMAGLDNSLQRLALTLVDSGLIDNFATFAERLAAVVEGFSGVEVAANSLDGELGDADGARSFGENLREISDSIENFRLRYGAAMDEWMAQNTAARQQIADWVNGVGMYFDNLAARARQTMQLLYVGVKTYLQDKLGSVFAWVEDKILAVENSFAWLYDRVVGNSWIPDMVIEVGQNMAKLQTLMVDPATKATQKTDQVFRELARNVSDVMDRLFPRVAQLRAMYDDIATIEAGVSKGLISADVGEEARRRARRSAAGLPLTAPDVKVSDDLLNTPSLIDGMDKIQTKLRGLGDSAREQTVRIAKTFKDMADDTLSALDRMANAIKGGGFLDILQGVLGLGLQLGSVGAFGSKIAANINKSVPGYAGGTNFHPGGLAMVGERGPELVSMPRGSRVFTNRESMGMMGGKRPYFDLRGAVMTEDLLRQMNAIGEGAAQAGAIGGATLAGQQSAFQRSRRLA